ncbi:phosphotransferase [Glycomyces luteolus]|uniref:Phosphotransferase n=1 Tax=Glycomyces luteolus TaxID=2670330 RepID=A0A9X3STY8_9ACTN|nr:phosphotransferase [Glycomyces luteolus]MDA1360748.1 phosphotransferase [Glycomyces luteolus]
MPQDPYAAAPADLDALASAYGLGGFHEIRHLPDGRMNRNWYLDTDRGRFALKHLTDRDPEAVRRNLGFLDRLAAVGIPVAAPVADRSGELVTDIDGNAYYLCEWIDGTHPGAELTPAQAEHMGALIARIHDALADPALGLPAPQQVPTGIPDPAAALAETGRFLELAAGHPAQDSFDRAAAPVLRQRLDLIAAHAHRRPGPNTATGPRGWTHGDCQNFNLIWSGDHVKAVIDWDRIRVGSYAEELARAAAYQFCTPDARIDLPKVAAFLTGYGAIRPMDPGDLAAAARLRWWKILAHCWQLDFHYDRGDPGCDDLFFRDHRLIAWWTANLEAVEATFGGPALLSGLVDGGLLDGAVGVVVVPLADLLVLLVAAAVDEGAVDGPAFPEAFALLVVEVAALEDLAVGAPPGPLAVQEPVGIAALGAEAAVVRVVPPDALALVRDVLADDEAAVGVLLGPQAGLAALVVEAVLGVLGSRPVPLCHGRPPVCSVGAPASGPPPSLGARRGGHSGFEEVLRGFQGAGEPLLVGEEVGLDHRIGRQRFRVRRGTERHQVPDLVGAAGERDGHLAHLRPAGCYARNFA